MGPLGTHALPETHGPSGTHRLFGTHGPLGTHGAQGLMAQISSVGAPLPLQGPGVPTKQNFFVCDVCTVEHIFTPAVNLKHGFVMYFFGFFHGFFLLVGYVEAVFS